MANFKEASSFLAEWMTEQMRKREEKLKKSKQKANRNFKARCEREGSKRSSCEHEFMFLNTAPHTTVGSHWLLAITTIGEGNSLVVVGLVWTASPALPKLHSLLLLGILTSFIKTGVQLTTLFVDMLS